MPVTHESAEDYLERILILEEERGNNDIRAVDIAKSFSYSKPSVSIAMKKLENGGYVELAQSSSSSSPQKEERSPRRCMRGIRSSARSSLILESILKQRYVTIVRLSTTYPKRPSKQSKRNSPNNDREKRKARSFFDQANSLFLLAFSCCDLPFFILCEINL